MSIGIPPVTSLFPPFSTYSSNRKPTLPLPGITLPKLPALVRDSSFLDTGLTTPPVDDMSATYQAPLGAYDGHGMQHNFPPTASAGCTKMSMMDSRDSQQHSRLPLGQSLQRHMQQPQSQIVQVQPQLQSQAKLVPTAQSVNGSGYAAAAQLGPSSCHSTRNSTPGSETAMNMAPDGIASRRGSETLVYHSLQIPKCISPQGGNLAEFAAQMTCLFWFESTEELKVAGNTHSRPPNAPVPPLPALAKPHDQFRKWVFSVLSTTQVTQNVILLALLFIYRLKMSTPQIKGRAGSEYRLLTVALMLGNKFLDDNTYTNKTWAEVSCFAVSEIHVMEVEFLSNMRYNLLASKEEWEEWLLKLASFHTYYDRSLNTVASPVGLSPPSNGAFRSPLPSPTRAMLPKNPDFPFPTTPTGMRQLSPTSSQSQNWAAYQANAVSPLAAKPAMVLGSSRKRSPEVDISDRSAKRSVPPRHVPMVSAPAMVTRPDMAADASRLNVPQLTLVTNTPVNAPLMAVQQQQAQQQPQFVGPSGYPVSSAPVQNMVSLPPLQPGVRAMSTVYQGAPAAMAPQAALPVAVSQAMPPSTFTGAPLPSQQPVAFGTPGKHHSPANLAPYAPSPVADFVSASAVHTPISHTPLSSSPSVYLQQRASPYKPIRHVNTLLYPPPSASLDQYHLTVPVQPTQMHYQPLGRRNVVRTGVVPEFVLFNRGQHQPLPSQGPPQGHYQP